MTSFGFYYFLAIKTRPFKWWISGRVLRAGIRISIVENPLSRRIERRFNSETRFHPLDIRPNIVFRAQRKEYGFCLLLLLLLLIQHIVSLGRYQCWPAVVVSSLFVIFAKLFINVHSSQDNIFLISVSL